MSNRVIAGPGLLTPCLLPVADWLPAAGEWVQWSRRLEIRFVATPGYWTSLADCGCYPSPPDIRTTFLRAGLPAAVPSAMTLIAGLVALTDTVTEEAAVTEWSTSGCLGSRADPRTVEDILAAAITLGLADVAGSALRDEEEARIKYLDGASAEARDGVLHLGCHPSPESYLDALDPIEFADEPHLAIELACARLGRVCRRRTQRFEVLPQLADSLKNLQPGEQRNVLETAAVVLLPLDLRPTGLEEHPLRTGPGANDPPRRGRRGAAKRVDISMSGSGWRLHFWRGEDGVTFSNVVPERSAVIYD